MSEPPPAPAVARFAELTGGPDASIDLGRAALTLALGEYPDLDVPAWVARLDALAAAAAPRLPTDPHGRLAELLRFLFEEQGLRGNSEDYYDPRNSYLHEVLRRRLGLPISLSVLLLEVGRRLSVPLQGVGFPAHFLVRWTGPAGEELLVDPFHSGAILSEEQCAALLEQLTGGALRYSRSLLAPAGPRAILVRMLRNLKAIHVNRNELDLALLDLERLVSLLPEDPGERRDRGLLLAALGRPGRAVPDLEHYLADAPLAEDRARIEKELERARARLWTMN